MRQRKIYTSNESGQGLVEYALIVVVIIAILVGGYYIYRWWFNSGNTAQANNTSILDIEKSSDFQVIPSNIAPERSFIDAPFEVFQNNCGGTADASNVIERSQTIIYQAQVGNQVTVDVSGKANLPLLGEVEVGISLAHFYSVTYGKEESQTRSLTISARPGTNMSHLLQKVEYWEVGELVWEFGDGKVIYPYRFRKDFGIELAESKNLGCP
jgi:hypothetical protein